MATFAKLTLTDFALSLLTEKAENGMGERQHV